MLLGRMHLLTLSIKVYPINLSLTGLEMNSLVPYIYCNESLKFYGTLFAIHSLLPDRPRNAFSCHEYNLGK